jgi:hypothetical protein
MLLNKIWNDGTRVASPMRNRKRAWEVRVSEHGLVSRPAGYGK